ncbi:MAG: MotA/TolQ/ExbB proton channel family protein [Gammaproteobacteria bacterium]
MLLYLLDALEAINNFFIAGGPVLYLIAVLTFVMWALMLERMWYFFSGYQRDADVIIKTWESRKERTSWAAQAIREKLISETRIKIEQNLSLIKTLIAVCPLFGLLGTVTGMIDVFTILSITGGGDAKSMAGGVSRATIPTMAGMVAALSGVFANIYITRKASREKQLIEEHLTMDH